MEKMYTDCPACNTRFVIAPGQIGPRGRKVKCSKCSHVWSQGPLNLPKIEPVLTSRTGSHPATGGSNLPVLLPLKIPSYLSGLPVLLTGMIIFMAVTLFPGFMRLTPFLNDKNLSVSDLQATSDKETNRLIVSYRLTNLSEKNLQLPSVRIRLFNRNGRPIESRIDDYRKIILSPSQYVNIDAEFAPLPPSAENIDIMIGNKLDFILY